ncbi:MAG: iron-sulfur cluster repair di-iron protein [Polyangiaceae bacterium]|nr:iron-sulfur cluster repair di-iron protein [Polyangiaceae bacterium]
MTFHPESIVADIVSAHPECARVFDAHRIDFCCGGRRSLSSACEARGCDPRAVLSELEAARDERRGASSEVDPRALPTTALIAHIVERHHAYVRRVAPFIEKLSAKVARVHGDRQPSLVALDALVRPALAKLDVHLAFEEAVVFPALEACADGDAVHAEVAALLDEHVALGRTLDRARSLTGDYTPAAWACNSYRTLYRELEALDRDLRWHVHLENNVLFARYVSSAMVASPPPDVRNVGPIEAHLCADHERIDGLLARARAGEVVDIAAFEQFRAELLRHIAMEEKVLLPDARQRRGAPLPAASTLRRDHGAIAALLVPTPTLALCDEIGALLDRHNALEEGPEGLYATCDALAGDEAPEVVRKLREVPPVPLALHYDGPLLRRREAVSAPSTTCAGFGNTFKGV